MISSLESIFQPVLLVAIGIIILGILVLIHELGHFIVAKLCGIRVLAFSIGFGTPLFKKEIGGTEYRISLIPFGGYVKMAGENPDDEKSGSADEFTSKPVWQRALVAVAGPVANFVFAFLMLWFMFVWGVEEPLYLERPVIGAVTKGSISENAGLQAGDSVLTINNKPMKSWSDINMVFALQSREYKISFVRDGQLKNTKMTMQKSDDLIPKDHTGGIMPPLPAVVKMTNPSSPAEKAGIQKGDTIVSVNGEGIYSWFGVLTVIANYDSVAKAPLEIVAGRKSGRVNLSVTPQYSADSKRYLIGVMVDEGDKRIVKYNVAHAYKKSVEKSWDYTTMIFDVVAKLLSREVSAKQLSGPIGIIPMSGGMALQGLSAILDFMGLIGINLAVLNLLPLVITDGGVLLFLLFEAVRRKPVSIKTQMIFNKIAIAFFLFLFLYVTLNDIQRMPDYIRIFGR